jgi:hypothetical protein
MKGDTVVLKNTDSVACNIYLHAGVKSHGYRDSVGHLVIEIYK